MKQIAAFFDVDDTILLKPYGVSFAKYLIFENKWASFVDRMNLNYIIKMLNYLLSYKLLKLDYEELLKTALELFKGISKEKFYQIGQESFDKYAKYTISNKIFKIIKKHKEREEEVVLLTSDIEPFMKPIADYLGLTKYITTKLIFKNGIFTGEAEKPYCAAKGKTILAEKFTSEEGIDFKDCYFYTNSIDDIHFMKRVGNPVAVNPDIKLLIEAKKRNWVIIHTSKTISD